MENLDFELAKNIGLCLLLGLIIGMQRALNYLHAQSNLSYLGARSFTLIALLGYFAGYANKEFPILTIVIFIFVSLLIIVSYVMRSISNKREGTTSEFAALLTFIIGILMSHNLIDLAIFTTVIVLIVLEVKDELRYFMKRIDAKEVNSMVIFLAMAFVIFPIIPNQNVDPYGLFNPYAVWFMVILISGLSFAGYAAQKIVGTSKGLPVVGFFGGLVSSTATTIMMSRKVDKEGSMAKQIAVAISIACTTMFARIVLLIFVINKELAMELLLPFAIATVVGYGYIYFLYKHASKYKISADSITYSNPLELSSALKLGILFGIIFGATKVLQKFAGDFGVYILSFFSGLTDLDAIALSLAELINDKKLALDIASVGVLIAAFANTALKTTLCFTIGNAKLGKEVVIALAIPVITAVAVFALSKLIG